MSKTRPRREVNRATDACLCWLSLELLGRQGQTPGNGRAEVTEGREQRRSTPTAHSLQAHRREPSAFQPGDCSGQYRRCSQGRYGWGRRARRSSSSVVTRHLPLVIDLDDPVPARRLRKSPDEHTPGAISRPTRGLKLGPLKPGVVGSDCLPRNREDFSPTQSCRLIRRRRSDFGVGVRRMTTANQQSQGCD